MSRAVDHWIEQQMQTNQDTQAEVCHKWANDDVIMSWELSNLYTTILFLRIGLIHTTNITYHVQYNSLLQNQQSFQHAKNSKIFKRHPR